MRRLRYATAAALAIAGTVLVLASPADAVSAPTSGWWARLATADPAAELPVPLPVPAPTTPDTLPAGATAPPGQLMVEGTPDGATAIAAIRWQLDPGEASPSLTLPIAPGSSVNPESIVLACRTATPWEPPGDGPGSWDVKPLTDAVACVNGVVADDLSTISFGLQPLVSGNGLDVVLAPGRSAVVEVPPGVPEPPVNTDGSSFRLLFDPPTEEMLDIVAGDFEEGAGDQVVTPEPASTPDLSGGVAPPATFETPSSASFDANEPVAAPALDPEDIGPSVPELDDAVRAAAANGPVNRTVGWVMLVLAGLVAAWTHWSSLRAATGDVEPDVGGLSRFARARTGPPTPLT